MCRKYGLAGGGGDDRDFILKKIIIFSIALPFNHLEDRGTRRKWHL